MSLFKTIIGLAFLFIIAASLPRALDQMWKDANRVNQPPAWLQPDQGELFPNKLPKDGGLPLLKPEAVPPDDAEPPTTTDPPPSGPRPRAPHRAPYAETELA